MVMKRYPNGINGEFFFMKRAPRRGRVDSVCPIEHGSGNVIDFPVIQHLVVAAVGGESRVHRSESLVRALRRRGPARYLHFDLDPVLGASFARVLETALIVRDALESIKIKSYAKTTGSRGIHVYVSIERGPDAKAGVDVCQGARRRNWNRGIPK